MSNLSASELLEEALLHIGEPYFHQLTQDIEILVDVINHEQTQRFIREMLVRNHEELIEQCREIEDAKSLCDFFARVENLDRWFIMDIWYGDRTRMPIFIRRIMRRFKISQEFSEFGGAS